MLKELLTIRNMLKEEDIKLLLQDFPLLRSELCYEIMTHKKVLGSNAILAIPEGKKYFAWFTSHKNDNLCLVLELDDNKQILDVQIAITSFVDKLSLGTVFYGTLFNHNNNKYFCVEDLYYYSGKSYYNCNYYLKLEILKYIFKNEISQTALTNNFTIFGLPLILNDLQLLLKEIQLLPYKISELKFRFFDNVNTKKIMVMKYIKPRSQQENNNRSQEQECVFKIMADIDPDIYNLFVYKNGVEEYYDIAFIPDYKTSVMMNKLFRNIKENNNLDAIEESDTEEEFQDNREDKYVYLDRSYKMKCKYNSKFKRWTPVSLAGKNERIISLSLIKDY